MYHHLEGRKSAQEETSCIQPCHLLHAGFIRGGRNTFFGNVGSLRYIAEDGIVCKINLHMANTRNTENIIYVYQLLKNTHIIRI
jgi:hypothetical protein